MNLKICPGVPCIMKAANVGSFITGIKLKTTKNATKFFINCGINSIFVLNDFIFRSVLLQVSIYSLLLSNFHVFNEIIYLLSIRLLHIIMYINQPSSSMFVNSFIGSCIFTVEDISVLYLPC